MTANATIQRSSGYAVVLGVIFLTAMTWVVGPTRADDETAALPPATQPAATARHPIRHSPASLEPAVEAVPNGDGTYRKEEVTPFAAPATKPATEPAGAPAPRLLPDLDKVQQEKAKATVSALNDFGRILVWALAVGLVLILLLAIARLFVRRPPPRRA